MKCKQNNQKALDSSQNFNTLNMGYWQERLISINMTLKGVNLIQVQVVICDMLPEGNIGCISFMALIIEVQLM